MRSYLYINCANEHAPTSYLAYQSITIDQQPQKDDSKGRLSDDDSETFCEANVP